MNREWTQTGKWMVIVAVALAAGPVAWAQSSGAKVTTGATRDVTAPKAQPSATAQELGSIALRRIAKANKYAFVFFFRADDERTRTMREALESAVADIPDKAEVVAVDVTDPMDKAIVNRFKLSRAPMPLILAFSPSGAITKYWMRSFDGRQLEQAFVSPSEAKCLRALQWRRMVLVCIQNDKTAHNEEAMQGVSEFRADRRYAARTAVVLINPTDESEAGFLKKLRVSPETEEAVTVLLAPPGRPVATFTGETNKADIIAAAKKAGSSCDPKSGCCSPKKPAGKKAGGQKSGQKRS